MDDLAAVSSREDVLRVLAQLRSDLSGPGALESENSSLERFLEALEGFLADLDGYFASRGEPVPAQPDWRLLVTLLDAATGYE